MRHLRNKATALRSIAAGLVLGATLPAMAWAGGPDSFFDPFDTFERSRWRISDGWVNGDWQNCIWSDQNVSLEAGRLILSLDTAMAGPRSYACGEVQTRERYLYGTYEVRMRSPAISGANAAFFSYIGPIHEAPHGEIDIEILTRDPSRVSFNTYVKGEPLHGTSVALPARADQSFTTLGFRRSADRVQWFVNGELAHEATGDLPSLPHKIFLSFWGTDTLSAWMGDFDADALPAQVEFDWVAFTAPEDRCLFPESLTCSHDFPAPVPRTSQ